MVEIVEIKVVIGLNNGVVYSCVDGSWNSDTGAPSQWVENAMRVDESRGHKNWQVLFEGDVELNPGPQDPHLRPITANGYNGHSLGTERWVGARQNWCVKHKMDHDGYCDYRVMLHKRYVAIFGERQP